MPGITPQLNDILQMRVEASAGTQVSLNVVHYRVSNVLGGGLTLQQLATQATAALAPLYRQLMPTTAIFQYTEWRNVTPPETVGFRGTSSAAGTAVGNLLPRQVSALIGWHTNLAGRQFRGRNYIGMLSDTFVDVNGEFNGVGFATLVNLATLLGPAISYTFAGATLQLVLCIRHPDTVGPPKVINTTDALFSAPSTGLATQRRRGDFGRQNRP